MGEERRNARSRKAITKQFNVSNHQASRNCTIEKLIPELSRLLDEGKINQGSASLYAKVSSKNQKKIYNTLMDNFLNDKFIKKEGSIS